MIVFDYLGLKSYDPLVIDHYGLSFLEFKYFCTFTKSVQKAKPIVEKVEKPKLLDRPKPSSTVANNTADSKKAKNIETKKPIQKQPPKSVMSEKAEKAVEKIEKSVNKENLENGDDEGEFNFHS